MRGKLSIASVSFDSGSDLAKSLGTLGLGNLPLIRGSFGVTIAGSRRFELFFCLRFTFLAVHFADRAKRRYVCISGYALIA